MTTTQVTSYVVSDPGELQMTPGTTYFQVTYLPDTEPSEFGFYDQSDRTSYLYYADGEFAVAWYNDEGWFTGGSAHGGDGSSFPAGVADALRQMASV